MLLSDACATEFRPQVVVMLSLFAWNRDPRCEFGRALICQALPSTLLSRPH